jgi:putative transposase
LSVKQRRAMVDRQSACGESLSVVRQCQLLGISRSGLYYQPKEIYEEDLTLMKLIDRQYLVTPFYGARKMAAWLKSKGHLVNRKRVRRLMRTMGLKAIYRRPRTVSQLLIIKYTRTCSVDLK